MGFSLNDLNPFAKGHIFDNALRGIDDTILGGDAEDAAIEAGLIQQQAATQASDLFNPFQQLGVSGLEQSQFLTDPNAQFDFLQSNPLFQLGLDNLNQQTNRTAKATGRIGAGDTDQQIINNALLAASPLIQQQKQSIGGLLDYGFNVANQQGNLLTGGAAAQAGGVVGGANARSQGIGNLLNLGGQIGGALLAPTPTIAPKVP